MGPSGQRNYDVTPDAGRYPRTNPIRGIHNAANSGGPQLVVMMQTLPFYDEASMKVYAGVEEAIYKNLK